TFPEPDLVRLKQQTIAGIQQEKTQPRGIAMRLFPRLVYGEGHAYANPFSGAGTAESVTAMKRGDLQAFHRRWVRPDNATLLVVGEMTLDATEPRLGQRLAAWKNPAEALPKNIQGEVPPQSTPRVFLVNRTGAEQSTIVAGYAGPPRSDPQYVAIETLNTILGG